MPSYTSGLALPYPTSGEPPDGPGAFAALCNRVEATLGADSGWVSMSTMYSGFTGTALYRRLGRTVTVMFRVLSDGAGDKTAYDEKGIVIVPSGYRPTATLHYCASLSDNTSNGVGIHGYIDTAGAVRVLYGYSAPIWISATVTYVAL